MNREDEILNAIVALHQATEMGFQSVDTRFAAVDKRFDVLETRFDALETRFDALETRFDRFQWEARDGFAGVNRRLDRLERQRAT